MKLVIVESPAKARTIQQYLGSGYKVVSSFGHVRDLPKSELGVDTANKFEPRYIIPSKAKKNVAALKKAAASADEIFFATDEDREGEAIAWHLQTILKVPAKKARRITFGEITKPAIERALENPRAIDQHLVDAQQARRVLDRLVGYELSPLLWKKVRRGLSAGRVQSVAVRLIVEREDAVNAFKPQEYWSLTAHLAKGSQPFTAKLTAKGSQRYTKLAIKNKAEAQAIVADLAGAAYTVASVKAALRRRLPPPPFTTSTLQQAAVNKLGFSSKRTMRLAQQLYEGIDVGDSGPTGLITYMRTDSVNLAAEALQRAATVIKQEFGERYALPNPRVFQTKTKGAQEAHEAIRPTDPGRLPSSVAEYLSSDQVKLYRLIWERMVASQTAEAQLNQVTADIAADAYTFRAAGTTIAFDGFLRVLGEQTLKETVLPPLTSGDALTLTKLSPEQHFTQPPPRYSEATLVKALEEYGIGRPSTYAPTIDTIQQREYVVKNEEKRFVPTEVGTIVTNLLKDHFPNIVDLAFTAGMEESLDSIAAGRKEWQPTVGAFYAPFHQTIERKQTTLSKQELTQTSTGERCPDCGHELVIKLGRYGKFKACSNFPACKHTEPVGEEAKLSAENGGEACPDCGRPLVLKRGRFGPFLGCSGYPDCKHIKKVEKKIGLTCPACQQGEIVEKRSRRGKMFYACNRYPDCKNAYWSQPTGETCPQCSSLLVAGTKGTTICSNKECAFKKVTENNDQAPFAE